MSALSQAAGVLLLAGWAAFAIAAVGESRDVNSAAQSLIARGEYVARAADCVSCHTEPNGVPYAGGNGLKSPFGTIYGPNITSDSRTGIGTWTRADFERALRLGIRKDGAYLYPAMPYTSYTQITAGDLNALWAYLRSIKPVVHEVRQNTLPFPFSVRSGLSWWQSLYFHPHAFEPSRDKSADWNRGAYLVKVLGHCGECHTPRTVAQGLQPNQALTGASVDGWWAPDISQDSPSKLGDWTAAQLALYLKTGRAPGNSAAVGPMATVVHESLQYLKPADLSAMASYLKDSDEVSKSHIASVAKLSPDRLSAGELLYADHCSSCHQPNGRGIKGAVPSLVANDMVTAAEPSDVIMAVLEGFPARGPWGAMGSFGNTMSNDQIADVSNYVRVAWGNQASPNATPWGVSKLRVSAQIPAVQPKGLLCPSLSGAVLQPALAHGADELKLAARDPRVMSRLVDEYRAARPGGTTAQTIEALSTAYCRALAQEPLSSARIGAMLASFSQKVAIDATEPD